MQKRTKLAILFRPFHKAPGGRTHHSPSLKILPIIAQIIIVSGMMAALATIGCRGGGANPGDDDLEISFIEPTQSSRTCLNDVYPAEGPLFEEVSDADYRPGANGIEYAILETGDGTNPGEDWQFDVQYTGWLEDGCVFGTSYNTERPARFFLPYVIPGWQQSLLDMEIGERRRIKIPSDLGYGQAGSPPRIPANATLIFDVKLVDGITGEDAQATATAVTGAARATITAIAEEVEATFTAIAEEPTTEPETSEP